MSAINVTDTVARAAVALDLQEYAKRWQYVFMKDVEHAYGPVEPNGKDQDALARSGICALSVRVSKSDYGIKVSWDVDTGHCNGIKVGDAVVISNRAASEGTEVGIILGNTSQRISVVGSSGNGGQ